MDTDLISRVSDAYLQTAEGTDAARLRFLEGLWDIQARFAAVDRPYAAPDASVARESLVTGKPLFLVAAPEVPIAEYLDAVSRVAAYAGEMAGLPAERAEAAQSADFASAIDAELLSSAACSSDAFVAAISRALDASADGPLTPATVAFVLMSALVPFLIGPSKKAIGALDAIDSRVWTEGHCPVCGSAAAIGRMSESTQLQGAERTLWCGTCHAEWAVERIRCVRCGTRNPDVLRYTYVEEDSAHRIHLCDECHGYAKFVFVDDLGKPVSMVVEDAVMTTLDAVAAQQGYTSLGDGGTRTN